MFTFPMGFYSAQGTSEFDLFGDGSAVAFYKFNSDVTDLGDSYNGTASGISYVTGQRDNCLSFDSTASYVTTAMPVLKYADSWTVCFWTKWDGTTTSSYYAPFHSGDFSLEWKGTPDQYIYIVLLNNSTTGVFKFDGYDTAAFTDMFVDNAWHHIAITHAGNTSSMSLYRDGTFYSSSGSSGGGFDRVSTTTIGYISASYTAEPTAFLDNFRIFNKVLDSTEVTTVYNE